MERKVWVIAIILFLCSLCAAGTAMAGVVFNQLPADYATWTGTVNLDKNWVGTWDGYYVGYSFNFKDGTTTYNELSSLCIDPSDFNSGITYSIESLSTALTNYTPATGQPTADQYLKAAWLLTQYQAGVYTLYDTQVAAWQILGILPGNFSSTKPDPTAWAAYQDALLSNLQINTLPNDIYVAVSPADGGLSWGTKSQDYMFCVPEPSTLLLFIGPVLGLLGLEAFRKKFRTA